MSYTTSNPVMFEQLEGRTMMSAALPATTLTATPTQPAVHATPGTVRPLAATTQTLAQYIKGTWVHTIGNYFGVVMQVKQVWNANGTYVTQTNYRLDAYGLPRQTAWTTKDWGTWKAMTGTILPGGNGVIYATSTAPATRGRLNIVYIRASSAKLVDMGVLPGNASAGTKPIWMYYGRMV